jgi:hypothetical protein
MTTSPKVRLVASFEFAGTVFLQELEYGTRCLRLLYQSRASTCISRVFAGLLHAMEVFCTRGRD